MEKEQLELALHPLTNFEIQAYYQIEPRFIGVYSRDNLHSIKDGCYIINLYEHSDTGTHWIALYVNNKNVAYLIALKFSRFQQKSKSLLIIKT